jgi:carbamoyltransferase
MIEWGINALNHDASIAVFANNKLVLHRRSSEFSGIIGDSELNQGLVDNCLRFGYPDKIYWYERPMIKKFRQAYAGQWRWAFDLNEFPQFYLQDFLTQTPIVFTPHHKSHAAAGYYTSPFDHCAVVVIDAIGEWESISIWEGQGKNLRKKWSRSYPTSLGLFYSAFADLLGFVPTKEEYLLQQLSDQGNPHRFYGKVKSYFDSDGNLKSNLHKGITDWGLVIDDDRADIAAAVQLVFEEQVDYIMLKARDLVKSNNLVYMGGCAMNSKYNKRLGNRWEQVWSLPYPGDACSAVGAVLAKKKIKVSYDRGTVKHLDIKTVK